MPIMKPSSKKKGKEINKEDADSAPTASSTPSVVNTSYTSAGGGAGGGDGRSSSRGAAPQQIGRRGISRNDLYARPKQHRNSSINDITAEDLRSLEETYARIAESEKVKENLSKIFKRLRIMVVGRSGTGKTTIIRLVVGEKGPRNVANKGTSGVHDVSVEWHHPDPDLPLIFHDSNGIDQMGAKRLDDIMAFMDEHQNEEELEKQIHVLWYVFSAADNRYLDDFGLLEMLDKRYPTLPIILIMTYYDVHETLMTAGRPMVDAESMVKALLGRISNPNRRQHVEKRMVRLGNSVQLVDGSIQAGGVVDVEGLKCLTQNTKDLINKELRWTWVASQAHDTDEKLKASAELIISMKRCVTFITLERLDVI
jgi:energy-coupling factor transporter ATP-binding protein EcfA2